MMLPTFTMGPVIEMLHWWGHQRHRGDVYQPRFDALSSYWSVVPRQPGPRRLTMHRSDGARERPSEHHEMIIFSAMPYNQRLTTLNTHQWPTPVQRRHHSYAQKSFGEAATAKYVHFFAQTPYPFLHVCRYRVGTYTRCGL